MTADAAIRETLKGLDAEAFKSIEVRRIDDGKRPVDGLFATINGDGVGFDSRKALWEADLA